MAAPKRINQLPDAESVDSTDKLLLSENNRGKKITVGDFQEYINENIPDTDVSDKLDTDLGNANSGLTDDEKSSFRGKIGAGTSSFSGDYDDLSNKPEIPEAVDITGKADTNLQNISDSLTDTEKGNVRANIGAGTSSFSGSYNDLADKPTIPTLKVKDFAGTYAELKASTSNTYTNGEIWLVDSSDSEKSAYIYANETTKTNVATTDADWSPVSTDIDVSGKADVDLQNISSTLSDTQKATVRTRIGAGTPYTLPDSTTTTKGGVIVGDGLSVTDGTVSVADNSITLNKIKEGTVRLKPKEITTENLNDLANGSYINKSNSNATLARNYPKANISCIINSVKENINHGTQPYGFQTAFILGNNERWFRNISNGTWKDWVLLHTNGADIETEHIADGAITTVKLADDAVTNAKILDGTISDVKLNISGTKTTGYVIKATASGVEWSAESSSEDELPDIVTGDAGKVLKVNSTEDGVEWGDDTDTTYTAGVGLSLNDSNEFSVDNPFTEEDETKLDGVEASADVTDSENVEDALTAGNGIEVSSDDTATVSVKLNGTTLTNGTDGLSVTNPFTEEDETKLDGIESGANNYTLPIADTDTVGGVKQGSNVTIADDGTITANSQTANDFTNVLKTKLDGIAEGAGVTPNWVPETDPNYLTTDTNPNIPDAPSVDDDTTKKYVLQVTDTDGTETQSWVEDTDADTDTTYTAGTGLSLSETNEFSVTNPFTDAEKTKLGGIAEGAEVNVKSNWTETDTESDSYIQNKPTNLTVFANTTGNVSTWAEGGNTDKIPASKIPVEAFETHVFSGTYTELKASVTNTFNEGEIWLVNTTNNEKEGYIYISSLTKTNVVTTDDDWSPVNTNIDVTGKLNTDLSNTDSDLTDDEKTAFRDKIGAGSAVNPVVLPSSVPKKYYCCAGTSKTSDITVSDEISGESGHYYITIDSSNEILTSDFNTGWESATHLQSPVPTGISTSTDVPYTAYKGSKATYSFGAVHPAFAQIVVPFSGEYKIELPHPSVVGNFFRKNGTEVTKEDDDLYTLSAGDVISWAINTEWNDVECVTEIQARFEYGKYEITEKIILTGDDAGKLRLKVNFGSDSPINFLQSDDLYSLDNIQINASNSNTENITIPAGSGVYELGFNFIAVGSSGTESSSVTNSTKISMSVKEGSNNILQPSSYGNNYSGIAADGVHEGYHKMQIKQTSSEQTLAVYVAIGSGRRVYIKYLYAKPALSSPVLILIDESTARTTNNRMSYGIETSPHIFQVGDEFYFDPSTKKALINGSSVFTDFKGTSNFENLGKQLRAIFNEGLVNPQK